MIVIVVGMHRSGTSALAGMLNDNGIHMGDKSVWHPPPMKENPKGFFENRLFRTVNDQVLRENGYRVKSFDPAVPDPAVMDISESARRQMVKLVMDYNAKYKHWGWKDPRTCLTLGLWVETIADLGLPYKLIMIYRNNLDIAISMKARGNKPSLGSLATLATAYYKTAKKQHTEFIEVQYADLMYNVDQTLHNLGEALGIKLLNGMHIDPTLADRTSRQDHTTEALNANRC